MTNITSYGQKHQNRAGLSGYVAELGAALLCADFGLTPEIRDDHAPYIGHWLQLLGDDPQALFAAAAHAERAVSYLRGRGETAAAEAVAVAESETVAAATSVPGA